MSGYQNTSLRILKVLETFLAAFQGRGKGTKPPQAAIPSPLRPVMFFRNTSPIWSTSVCGYSQFHFCGLLFMALRHLKITGVN